MDAYFRTSGERIAAGGAGCEIANVSHIRPNAMPSSWRFAEFGF